MNIKSPKMILTLSLILAIIFTGMITLSVNLISKHTVLFEKTNKFFEIQATVATMYTSFYEHVEFLKKNIKRNDVILKGSDPNTNQYLQEMAKKLSQKVIDPEMLIHASELIDIINQVERFEKINIESVEKSLIEIKIHSMNFYKNLEMISLRISELNAQVKLENDKIIKQSKMNAVFIAILGGLIAVFLSIAVFTALSQNVSKTYVQSIVQTIGNLLIVFDEQGRVLISNKKARDILKYDENNFKQLHINDIFDKSVFEEIVKSILPIEFETICKTSSGDVIPIMISGTKHIVESNQLQGYIVSAQDLRSSKDLQRQLLQSEKMASLGNISAGIAHEINNPTGYIKSNLSTVQLYLTKIKSLLESYKEKEKNFSPADLLEIQNIKNDLDITYILEDINQALTDSLEGTDRISAIVQNLKMFSRNDGGKPEKSNINSVIENSIKLVWNELKYKCKVEKDFGELSPNWCYPNQLSQVFINLLINSSHAIKDNGTIMIKSRQDLGKMIITFADTGEGISKENINKIFDPFFTTKSVGSGTGLGLSVSYGIIKKHGGVMAVESELGKGTTFTITLPINGIFVS